MNSVILSALSAIRPKGNRNAAPAPKYTVSIKVNATPLALSSSPVAGSVNATPEYMNGMANCVRTMT